MLFAYLTFVLLCIGITLYISPVVIRYTKGTRGILEVHFVFFSLSFFKNDKKNSAERGENENGTSKSERTSSHAPWHALRYAIPRATVCVQSLPFPTGTSPFFMGVGMGAYYFVLSLFLSRFSQCTSDPMLITKKEDAPSLDIRFRVRLYTFLHTFLIYLAQYRKEKEARKAHVRNKNE